MLTTILLDENIGNPLRDILTDIMEVADRNHTIRILAHLDMC